AVIFFSGGCRRALFNRQPPGEGKDLWPALPSCALAIAAAHMARLLPALPFQRADEFHIRRYAYADRSWLCIPVFARVQAAEMAVGRVWRHPLRLLARLGALSDARPRIRLSSRRRSSRLGAQLYRLCFSLEQEQQSGRRF